MAIIKRSGSYQVKIRGTDGYWISRTFRTRSEADFFQSSMKVQKKTKPFVSARIKTVDEFFRADWLPTVEGQASAGWRRTQLQLYRDYIFPILGNEKLSEVTPAIVATVLAEMARNGKGEQTRLHVFNLLRKLFGDVVELFQLLTFNPVIKKLKPKVAEKETPHLTLEQLRTLLLFVEGKPYAVAIWLQAFLGLRVGELQSLKWSDLDLPDRIVRIHSTYVRLERSIKDYPKGRKQHSKTIPNELWEFLVKTKSTSSSAFVAGMNRQMLSYEWYHRTLRRYCKALGLPIIGTHGLRHTTSKIYIAHGASKDDVRSLFGHRHGETTERYLHERNSTLDQVAKVIRLFPNVPKLEIREATKGEEVV